MATVIKMLTCPHVRVWRRGKDDSDKATKRRLIGRLAGTSCRKRSRKTMMAIACKTPHRTSDILNPSKGNITRRMAMKGE